MPSRPVILVALSLLFLPQMSCQEKVVSREAAELLLDSLEHKMDWMDYRMMEEQWEFYTTGTSDSLAFYKKLYSSVATDPRTFSELQQAEQYFVAGVERRRWELLYDQILLSQVESRPQIQNLRDSLSKLNIEYRATFDGEPRTDAYLYRLVRTDPDGSRREAAYRAWCSVGLQMADGLSQLIRIRNQEARRQGYNNYLGMVFDVQGLGLTEYLQLLTRLDDLSEARYREILDDIAQRLQLAQPEIWDLAYAYVDVSTQVDSRLPADSQIPVARRSLRDIGLNIDKLPIYFDLEPRAGKSQLAYAFPVRPPYDVRVLANRSDGLHSTTVLLHEIGHAIHYALVEQERFLFATSVAGSWTEGIAQIFAELARQPEWLTRYAGIPREIVDRHLSTQQERNIIGLRGRLLQLHFEYEAYSNPNRDLNKLYWDLFERYMMLPRHEDIKPWAAIIHYTTHPVYLQNYLLADIIAAQTVAYLKRNYGGVVDHEEVGAFLTQNYFRFGARYAWRELLERGTGEKLNPDYLLAELGMH